MIYKKMTEKTLTALILLGLVLGTENIRVQAADGTRLQEHNGNVIVTDPNASITGDQYFKGQANDSDASDSSVIYISKAASGGNITIGPGIIWGDLDHGDANTGNLVKGAGITIDSNYRGKVNVQGNTVIEMRNRGSYINGGAIETADANRNARTIRLGDGVKIRYTVNNENEKSTYVMTKGIYINGGTLCTGKDLSITMDGTLPANHTKTSTINSGGIFIANSTESSDESKIEIGDNLQLRANYKSEGNIQGVIAGLASQGSEKVPNDFHLGKNAKVDVLFSGQGGQGSTDYFEIDALNIWTSTFRAGDDNAFSVNLGENSKASSLRGATIKHSNLMLGNRNHLNVTAESESQVNYIYGTYAYDNSNVTFGDQNAQDIIVGTGTKVTQIIGNRVGQESNITFDDKNTQRITTTAGSEADNVIGTFLFTHSHGTAGNDFTTELNVNGKAANARAFQAQSGSAFSFGNRNTMKVTVGTESEVKAVRGVALRDGTNNGSGKGTQVTAGDDFAVDIDVAGKTDSVEGIYMDNAADASFTSGNNTSITVDTAKSKVPILKAVSINGKNNIALGKNARITANGSQGANGIWASGAGAASALGDNASINVRSHDGKNTYGVNAIDGAVTTFDGAAAISAAADNGLGFALSSSGEGSRIDMTGNGRKVITGNLASKDQGAIKLKLATGDSVFTGMSKVADSSTNLAMSNGAIWNVTADSAVTGLCNNSGATVNMTYNKDYQTLKMGTFSGKDGVFLMKSDLDSETCGDKVVIGRPAEEAAAASPSVTASGYISVYDKSFATGKEVTGTKRLLLITDNNKTAAFRGKTLNSGGLWNVTPTVQNGKYVREVMGDTKAQDHEWYLTKLEKTINPDTKALLTGMDSTYGLYRLSIDTLRQRLGDLRYRDRGEDKYDIWVRNRNGRFSGSGYDSTYNFFQAGADTMPDEKSAYGFLVERGIASPDYDHGNGKNHTFAGALYSTWLGDHGSYTDIVAKAGRNDVNLRTCGPYADRADYREKEQSLSIEYGRTIPQGDEGWFIEPQAQIIFGHLGSNSYMTERGTHVRQDSFNSAIGRLGFILGKKHEEGKKPYDFYLKASLLHEFGGDRDYSLRRTNAFGDLETMDGKYSYGDTWYEIGLGGTARLNESTYCYADVERSFASDYSKKWQFNAGFCFGF